MIEELDAFTKSPEHHLWANVVERALQDYVRFFDWYVARAQRSTAKSPDLTRASLKGVMAYELETLKWFFFSSEPVPFNLAWIFDHVFNADERLLETIRVKVKEAHYANLLANKTHPGLKHYLEAYSNAGVLAEIRTQRRTKKVRWRSGVLH
jgi:hypothetical protein